VALPRRVFNIVGSLVPLVFASVVLWRFDPLLVAGLDGTYARLWQHQSGGFLDESTTNGVLAEA